MRHRFRPVPANVVITWQLPSFDVAVGGLAMQRFNLRVAAVGKRSEGNLATDRTGRSGRQHGEIKEAPVTGAYMVV